mmetsp:Transcript_58137/g.123458  ORF Transcript_58137/g.123458 Transcript_58137/m.123458 type:complete len:293 (-) Transcript_58137:401-1279(-)
MLVEFYELVLEVGHGLAVQSTLHDVRQRHRKGYATVTSGAEDPRWVGLVNLCSKALLVLGCLVPHLLQVRQHRLDCITKHLLHLPLDELGEVRKADCLHVLGAEALRPHFADVLVVLILAKVLERLGRFVSLSPPREGEGEAPEVHRQVAIARDPLIDVFRCEIPVVLVELVADEDCAIELWIDRLASCERGHGGGVPSLLDTEHDVALVAHESHVQLLDLGGQILSPFVHSEVAEAGKIHDLHVEAAWRLDSDVDRLDAHRLSQLLVALPNDHHHLVDRVEVPLVRGGIPH